MNVLVIQIKWLKRICPTRDLNLWKLWDFKCRPQPIWCCCCFVFISFAGLYSSVLNAIWPSICTFLVTVLLMLTLTCPLPLLALIINICCLFIFICFVTGMISNMTWWTGWRQSFGVVEDDTDSQLEEFSTASTLPFLTAAVCQARGDEVHPWWHCTHCFFQHCSLHRLVIIALHFSTL